MSEAITAANIEANLPELMRINAWVWAQFGGIVLAGKVFQTEGHEYQKEMLACNHPHQVSKKGAQKGITEVNVLKTIHAHINGIWVKETGSLVQLKNGTMYLFPTWNDVTDFSKARFAPLISENPPISRFVKKVAGSSATDAATIKRINKTILYLRSAKETGKIGGMKATSSALKSAPADRLVLDERDEISDAMVDLAVERLSHSEYPMISELSTPSIPNYGIDKSYNESDGMVWVLKCPSSFTSFKPGKGKKSTGLGHTTCMELTFPDSLKENAEGEIYRACMKCGAELNPSDGFWSAQRPSIKEKRGWWISQLNSRYVPPGKILRLYRDPPHGNIAEVYNSKLGMAYIDAENQLSEQDVLSCCSEKDNMSYGSNTTCAMGVDIGKHSHHVIIGYPKNDGKNIRVLYIGRVPDYTSLHDLVARFNVKVAVLDAEPETHASRSFQREVNSDCRVYLCDYQERMKVSEKKDDSQGLITVKRTEICDSTVKYFQRKLVDLPRIGHPEIKKAADHLRALAKSPGEDSFGNIVYRYIKMDGGKQDHYFHSFNYLNLACREPVMKMVSSWNYDNGIAVQFKNDRDRNLNYDPLHR